MEHFPDSHTVTLSLLQCFSHLLSHPASCFCLSPPRHTHTTKLQERGRGSCEEAISFKVQESRNVAGYSRVFFSCIVNVKKQIMSPSSMPRSLSRFRPFYKIGASFEKKMYICLCLCMCCVKLCVLVDASVEVRGGCWVSCPATLSYSLETGSHGTECF